MSLPGCIFWKPKWIELKNAVSAGDSERVRELLKAGANVNATDSLGNTALHIASEYGNIECIRLLCDAGADVKKMNHGRSTPLLYAANYGCEHCVNLLLLAGADVNIYESNAYTVFKWAADHASRSVKEWLVLSANKTKMQDDYIHFAPLTLAIKNNQPKCVELLLEAGAASSDADTITPLMLAIKNNQPKYVELLLEAGAASSDSEKNCLLMWSASNGYDSFMEYQIKSGADVNRPLKHRIPLAEATFENHLSCVKLLLKAGADVKVQWKYYAKFRKLPSREMTLLLYAAGILFDVIVSIKPNIPNGQEFLEEIRNDTGLMSLCRETIRKQIVRKTEGLNLFIKVPRLGLPVVLTSYLLFGLTLS